jgi:hypothetical protein
MMSTGAYFVSAHGVVELVDAPQALKTTDGCTCGWQITGMKPLCCIHHQVTYWCGEENGDKPRNRHERRKKQALAR